ncbi:hypothetical protein [Flavobacterium sp. T12S277]|uniref:hypothetical protein n=1 Tax=Flavobacterium sp. T12S277 TaxID=3402752 RepID=UPI003ADB49CF
MYQIKVLEKNQIDSLQVFIKNNWNANHIFVTSKKLLLWQHGLDLNLNYLVAYAENNNEIIAVLGYIPTNHFDVRLKSDGLDLWLALWKGDDNYPGVGMDLLYHLQKFRNPSSIGSIGINKNVEKIYKILKYKIGELNHYYYTNPKIDNFKIISIQDKKSKFFNNSELDQEIEVVNTLFEVQKLPEPYYKPLKSADYFINRYERHPFYKYKFWLIKKSSEIISVLVVRKIEVEETSCIRVVDVLGDLSRVKNITAELNRILDDENSEYVDFLNFGIDEITFYQMGFLKKSNSEIIPNYFEPFIKSNNEIHFAYKSLYEPYVIFKGDSDQDRPNIIQNES